MTYDEPCDVDLVILPAIDGNYDVQVAELNQFEKELQTMHSVMNYLGLYLMLAPGLPMPILETEALRLKRADFVHRFATPALLFRARCKSATASGRSGGAVVKETFTRVVLGDQVKEYIIDAIINGEYQPGDRVVASTVSRQLGVSQAPVREAIRDLVMLGFLETEPFKGPSVRSFSRKELCEVYAVRASLEALAARLAASRLTPDDVESLQGMLEKMICAAEEQDPRK